MPADTLIAIGYGKAQLKTSADPFASENRRVQNVNTEMQAEHNAENWRTSHAVARGV